ncbi:MAG: hypothetical protein ACXACI_07620 [Candidatus Hodarchaeales archaeon]
MTFCVTQRAPTWCRGVTAGHYPASRALAPTLCPPKGVRSRWITRASRKLVSIART